MRIFVLSVLRAVCWETDNEYIFCSPAILLNWIPDPDSLTEWDSNQSVHPAFEINGRDFPLGVYINEKTCHVQIINEDLNLKINDDSLIKNYFHGKNNNRPRVQRQLKNTKPICQHGSYFIFFSQPVDTHSFEELVRHTQHFRYRFEKITCPHIHKVRRIDFWLKKLS